MKVLGVEPLRLGPGQLVRMNPLAEVRRHPGQNDEEFLAGNRSRRLALLEGMLEVSLRRAAAAGGASVLGWALDAATGADDPANARLAPVSLPTAAGASWSTRPAGRAGPTARPGQRPTSHDQTQDVRLALAGAGPGSLRGMFDTTDARNTAFDFRAPGTVVDLARSGTTSRHTVLAMVCAQSAMEAELMHPDAPRRIVGYDEAWMAMRYLPLLRRFQEQWKLARWFGIATGSRSTGSPIRTRSATPAAKRRNLAHGLLEDTGIKIAYRQSGEAALTAAAELMSLTDVQADLLRYLKVGVGLWKVGESTPPSSNTACHRSKRPIVDTDSRMKAIAGVDDITDEEWEALLEQTHDRSGRMIRDLLTGPGRGRRHPPVTAARSPPPNRGNPGR